MLEIGGMDMVSGERIKTARLSKNLSQEQLGLLIGVSDVSICGYEKGIRKPTIDKLVKLTEVLDVTMDYLLGKDKIVVAENEQFSIKMSNEEITFINEIRKFSNVHRMISDDPKRIAILINRKLS